MLDRKELILEGLAYTVMGIVIVFMILVIIMLVIKAMALFSKEKKPKAAPENIAPALEAVPEEESDEGELVAVITAAITCMTGQSSSGLVVRSYKKISGGAWNKAGRREVLNNRF